MEDDAELFVDANDHWVEETFFDCSSEDVQFLGEQLAATDGVQLTTVDYNLNSPLIPDKVEATLNQLRTGVVSLRFRNAADVQTGVKLMSKTPVDWGAVKATTGFHEWVAMTAFNRPISTHDLSDRLLKTTEESRACLSVVEAFWKGLTGKSLSNPELFLKREWFGSTPPKKTRLKSDGEAFWFFHRCTLMMNSLSVRERDSLAEVETGKLNWSVEEFDSPTGFRATGRDPDWGEVVITPGLVFLKTEYRLLDRNMVLMIKDTLAARFCTKLSLVGRSDGKGGPEALSGLEALYFEGDLLMSKLGNDAFDIVKLLEPHCNQRLSELARKARPLIPEFTNFSTHLHQQRISLERKFHVDLRGFFDMVMEEDNPEQVLLYYGSFRHWGHPFLDYLQGLTKLHAQVTMPKEIDEEYAKALASDLAYIILKHEFDKKRRWFVDIRQMVPSHPLYEHVKNTTWPTPVQVLDMGDIWADLPIVACYEVPQTIDPSVLYADKSHSMNKSDILNHIRTKPFQEVPSKKVLKTTLETPATDVTRFLQSVNDDGLDEESLIIGLKGKEREIKKEGRFFSLMSWKLREYFVITEYLIKMFYVPLFAGLTMADDMTSVIRKMMDSSMGQGLDDYSSIGIANHIDYEKWNNHQRLESNGPVFRVMGQFFGLPNLFERTHEFFQKSLIYYGDRPDLMEVRGNTLVNKTTQKVCWNGQAGGLEGLRQKGWSVLSLLIILREAKIRNTRVRTLAQGDNQVICTQYKIPTRLPEAELKENIQDAVRNNQNIMNAIEKGTDKLGLIINHDETLQSADYLNYGKVPVFRGNILPLEGKRWSRVTCVTNDQVPSLANVLSSVSTNALTVAQYSNSILEPMLAYCFFGSFAIAVLGYHSPLLQRGLDSCLKGKTRADRFSFYIRALYLDPSLGGVCGMSLTRFLIRMFPDPITESLTFWRIIFNHTRDRFLQGLAIESGYPLMAKTTLESWIKLMEKPTSLNLPKGLSATTLLRNEVRKNLFANIARIKNTLFSEAIKYLQVHEDQLLRFLKSVKPLFPRFLSEFRAGTFCGLTESLVGLFQNSRTIRLFFSRKMNKRVNDLLRLSEELSTRVLLKSLRTDLGLVMWECSSSHADRLRRQSWGAPVVGTTVPHPAEYMGCRTEGTSCCIKCGENHVSRNYVSICYPAGFRLSVWSRGSLCAYLGSKTTESTSLFQPWEKEMALPLLKRAARLRTAINWFVAKGSQLSTSIFNNLTALTGEDWDEALTEFSRTGSALHRFYCSRQSNGGFCALSPNPFSYILVTADTLVDFLAKNYDFMFQSTLLYCQLVSSEVNQRSNVHPRNHHFHVSCTGCIREIKDITLDSATVYTPPNVSKTVTRMTSGSTNWSISTRMIPIKEGKWDTLLLTEQSFHIGVAQGALFGFLASEGNTESAEGTLFPVSIGKQVRPHWFLMGLLKGILMASSYNAVYHRKAATLLRPRYVVNGGAMFLIQQLTTHSAFLNIVNLDHMVQELARISHRIPPSYPTSGRDLGLLSRNYLHFHLARDTLSGLDWARLANGLWIFADFKTPRLTGLMTLTHRLWTLLKQDRLHKRTIPVLMSLKQAITYYCSKERFEGVNYTTDDDTVLKTLRSIIPSVQWCSREVRHAAKEVTPTDPPEVALPDQGSSEEWGKEFVCETHWENLNFSSQPMMSFPIPPIPQKADPLISGLRILQLATGAHYKIRGILSRFSHIQDFLCGGDGSGGMTAAILRMFPRSRGIFNSLLDVNDRHLRGVAPGPPSAIASMPRAVRERCVNLMSCWKDPSDLSEPDTWTLFVSLRMKHNLSINLMVFDMEVRSEVMSKKIEHQIRSHLHSLMGSDGILIYKTYGSRIQQDYAESIGRLGSLFRQSSLVVTDLTSSFSSEVYLVCQGLIQGKIMSPYVTMESVRRGLNLCRVQKTTAEEFQRAVRIDPNQLVVGVPQTFIPIPEVELVTTLTALGMESGVASELVHFINVYLEEPHYHLPLILATDILLSNSILNTTRWSITKPTVPSDQKLQNHLTMHIGTWEFISWLMEDQLIYDRCRKYFEERIVYSYAYRSKQELGKRLYQFVWDWNVPGWSSKRLRRPDSLAGIGQVIRMWGRFFPRLSPNFYSSWEALSKNVDAITTSFNKSLNSRHTISLTGIYHPMFGERRVHLKGTERIEATHEEMDDEPTPRAWVN